MRLFLLFLCGAAGCPGAGVAPAQPALGDLLRDPSAADWRALSQFDRTLTRRDFENRLDRVLDPRHGLRPYLRLGGNAVAIYPGADQRTEPLVVVRFAPAPGTEKPVPVAFRHPRQLRGQPAAPGRPPLAGLRVVIEPADIGGRWARTEDRSVEFPGYGRINEGDLNLVVGRLLRDRLAQLGASVFLVRDRAEPVVVFRPEEVRALAAEVLQDRPWLLPESYQLQTASPRTDGQRRLHVAENLLLTKTLETRARVALVRRSFTPDVTIVLQHNATPESGEGRLSPANRNIFFVHGAYTPSELREPEQRFRLLSKLFQDTTPVEIEVAAAIAARFRAATGFAPVLSGNSSNTRLVLPNNPYVVARNLAFNREHDGPVVVTEPYFMNQPDTLVRLLAGDFAGKRLLAGKLRTSIYREYAECVAAGLYDAYHPGR